MATTRRQPYDDLMAVSLGRRSLLTLLLTLAVACGETESVTQTETASPSTSELPSPAASTKNLDDTGISVPGSTDQAVVIRKVVESPTLRVSIDLPADAIDDPLGDPIPPDWVIADDRWFIDGCCRIIVVLQSQRPLLAEDDRVASIDAAGLTWDLYEIGPLDGTTLSATATGGDVSFVVSIQELFFERVSDQSPLDILSTVVRSITLQPL